MIRNILTVIVFFFGPAILMFMLRNLFLFLKAWLSMRDARNAEPEVIDITPKPAVAIPAWFKLLAVLVGLLSAGLAWQLLSSGVEPQRHYVPAYVDQQGKIVPGHWEPANGR